jgi:hypothetical protein
MRVDPADTAAIKRKAAEALFPLLSIFHDVNGLTLEFVRRSETDGLRDRIILAFRSKNLILQAVEDDDTVEFWTSVSFDADATNGQNVSHLHPWKELIGREFGWSWVAINQQGYLDGVLLSFAGIEPRVFVTAVASSLKVSVIAGQ